MTIKLNCIKDVSFPRFYQDQWDVFSFVINNTNHQKIKFICSSGKLAIPHKDIVENESKRKNDVYFIEIAVALAIAYLIYYFWWL